MDFEYTPEQVALRDSVRRFVEREYDWDKRSRLVRAEPDQDTGNWPTFAELGWLGAGLSEEAGGFGGGVAENTLIAEELGRALAIEPFVGHVMASQMIAAIGGDIAQELMEPLVMGERRLAVALGEKGGEGDPLKIATRAEATGDGYRVSGAKSLVDGAAFADALLVTALRDGEPALFLVTADAAGLERQDYRTLDNHRVSDLTFADTPARLIAAGAVAHAAIARGLDHALITLAGEALGVMDAALWATRDYLKTRRQFGTPLGNFQALQHRMADMLIEVELTRSLLFHAIGVADGADAAARGAAASGLKVQIARGGLLVVREAIQMHGGIGVTEELNISHYYRRIWVISRILGDATLHLDRFADTRRFET